MNKKVRISEQDMQVMLDALFGVVKETYPDARLFEDDTGALWIYLSEYTDRILIREIEIQ